MTECRFRSIDLLTASGRLVRVRLASRGEIEASSVACSSALDTASDGAVHLVAELGGRIVAALTLLVDGDGHAAHLCLAEDERGDAIDVRLIDQAAAALGVKLSRGVAVCP